MAKSISKEKIIEGIKNLELPDILEVNQKTVQLIAEKEKEETEKLERATANITLIRTGGKKE